MKLNVKREEMCLLQCRTLELRLDCQEKFNFMGTVDFAHVSYRHPDKLHEVHNA